ncbi:uncharacterized protein LOC134709736 [Mytilus trossulus]|uniref:uncharacterized protein LOC134709736 n=1 Tax=Mytilus trossulus TaxID=6551 RepID=UPI0030045D40
MHVKLICFVLTCIFASVSAAVCQSDSQCKDGYHCCKGTIWCCPSGYACTGTSTCLSAGIIAGIVIGVLVVIISVAAVVYKKCFRNTA